MLEKKTSLSKFKSFEIVQSTLSDHNSVKNQSQERDGDTSVSWALQCKQPPRYRQTFQCTQPLLVFSGPPVQPSLQMFRAPLGYPGFQVSLTLLGYSGSQGLRGPQSLQRLEEAVAGVSVYTEEQELGNDTSKSASTGRRRTAWHWRQGLM